MYYITKSLNYECRIWKDLDCSNSVKIQTSLLQLNWEFLFEVLTGRLIYLASFYTPRQRFWKLWFGFKNLFDMCTIENLLLFFISLEQEYYTLPFRQIQVKSGSSRMSVKILLCLLILLVNFVRPAVA